MAEPIPLHRKLAAILAADIVAYSRLMEADEVGTLRQVRRVQATCIDPLVAAHGGRLIKSTGDGFLFEFASARDATLFGLGLQKKVQADMASVPEGKRLVFRLGVHAGDILSAGGDVFGNGVNIAARLEGLCTPGAICLSEVVQQQLRDIDLPTVDRGEHLVKNIERPVRVYEIEAGAIASTAAIDPEFVRPARRRAWRIALVAGAALVLVSIAGVASWRIVRETSQTARTKSFSVAVLPFATMSDDGKPDPFADALVENLTTDLSINYPSSTVISTASTFTYRGKVVDPRQAARELGAKYLLTGSLQKTADHLRINAHLIDGETDAQLWSDEFEGSLSDIATFHDQVTHGIANTLSLQLIRIEADREKYATNATALDLTFRALSVMTYTITPASSKAAEADLRQALALEPDNLMALKALADILVLRVSDAVSHFSRDDETFLKLLHEAQALLGRVRDKNPHYPGLHTDLGFIALILDSTDVAITHYRMEIQNDPSAASAYGALALCLVRLGKGEEAVPMIEKAIRLDPRSPAIGGYYDALAIAYFAVKKYPQAVEQAERAYDANPSDAESLFYAAAANALAGNMEAAHAKLEEARKLDPKRSVGLMRKSLRAKEATGIEIATRYIDGLKRAGLPD